MESLNGKEVGGRVGVELQNHMKPYATIEAAIGARSTLQKLQRLGLLNASGGVGIASKES